MRIPEIQATPLARPCSAWLKLVGGFLLLATVLSRADGSLVLAWDYEGEDDVAGFRLYWGFTSGFYALTNEVGLATEASVSNLLAGETYHFAVSSFDVLGRESDLSSEITYAVPVSSTNELPIISLIAVGTDEDQPVLLPLNGTNVLVAVPPSHGKVVGSLPVARYIPATNFSGPDSFKLILFDGGPVATKVEVSVNVRPVNDPPWTADKTVVTVTDTEAPIHLVAGDAEADTLQYVLETQPVFGSLVGNPPDLRYRPAIGFEGQDGFTFSVSDGELVSATGTVSISVLNKDGIPVDEESEFLISEDVPVAFLLHSYNPHRDSPSVLVLDPPMHGSLPALPPDVDYVEYQPESNYHGTDAVTFLLRQSDTELGLAKLTFVVAPVNDPPWTTNKTVVTVTDVEIPIHQIAGDVDGETLRYTWETPPAFGSLVGDPPDLRYRPARGFEGQDQFTYRVSDGEFVSNLGTVSISVLNIDRIPIVEEREFFILEDESIAFLMNSYNPYRGSVSAEALGPPLHGALTSVPPEVDYVEYRPTLNYHGSDDVTFLVRPSETEVGLAKIRFGIAPVNDIPKPNDSFFVTAEDTPASIEFTASDVEGDPLRYEIATAPEHGVLTGVAPNLFYLPATNYNGFDQLTFRVSDAGGTSQEAIVVIIIAAENDAPAAIGQSIATFENQPVTIVLRAQDVDGDELRYGVVTFPLHGSLSGDGPNLLYSPASRYSGPDSFTFKVKDGSTESEPALVTINVVHVPQITAVTLDGSSLTLTWSSVQGHTYLVRFSESLSSPAWRVVSGPLVATSTQLSWTHPGRERTSSGFYTLETVAP